MTRAEEIEFLMQMFMEDAQNKRDPEESALEAIGILKKLGHSEEEAVSIVRETTYMAISIIKELRDDQGAI